MHGCCSLPHTFFPSLHPPSIPPWVLLSLGQTAGVLVIRENDMGPEMKRARRTNQRELGVRRCSPIGCCWNQTHLHFFFHPACFHIQAPGKCQNCNPCLLCVCVGARVCVHLFVVCGFMFLKSLYSQLPGWIKCSKALLHEKTRHILALKLWNPSVHFAFEAWLSEVSLVSSGNRTTMGERYASVLTMECMKLHFLSKEALGWEEQRP